MNLPVRPYIDLDLGYVSKSWVNSMRKEYPFHKMSRTAIDKYAERVRALVNVTNVLVATDPEDPATLYGFICYENTPFLGRHTPTLHYVCVANAFRKMGIATSLFNSAFRIREYRMHYTHITRSLKNAGLEKKWNLSDYDPYLIEGALFRESRDIDLRAVYANKIPGQGCYVGRAGGSPST